MNEATDFKFSRYIRRVHPKKSPLKIFEKREHGRIQGLPNFFGIPTIIPGTWKAMDFKYGRYIHRVHPNKYPWKVIEIREHGHIQGLSNFLRYSLLSQKQVKLRTSSFACTFIGSIRTKNIKNFGTVAMGVVRQSQTFSGHRYVGRIARSSLRQLGLLVLLSCRSLADIVAHGYWKHLKLDQQISLALAA